MLTSVECVKLTLHSTIHIACIAINPKQGI